MKTLLISPTFKEMYKELKSVATDYPPLGLAYIAAILEKENHEVKIVDMSILNMSVNNLINEIRDYKPNLIGITLTTPLAETVYNLIKEIKKEFKDIKIILGGAHPTAVPEECLDKGADIIIRGEGEETALELINNINSLEKIEGISFKKEDKITHNKDRPFIQDLDKIPFPARHLLNIGKYDFIDAKQKPVGTILTSRGCPYQCVYCNKNISGHKFRKRSADNILKEINELINRYNVKEIHILDDAFTIDKQRVLDICNGVIEKKYNISLMIANGVRVDCIDEEVISKLKQAGLYSISFGVESGSQEVLNRIKKGITLEQVKTAFKISKKLKLETWGFFMLGLPGDTEKTMQQTIDFAKELNPDVAKFFITIPLPGTELFKEWESRMDYSSWATFNFYEKPIYNHPNLSKEKIVEYHKKAFREFYFRPKKIIQTVWRAKNPKRFISFSKASIGLLRKSMSS